MIQLRNCKAQATFKLRDLTRGLLQVTDETSSKNESKKKRDSQKKY